MLRYSQGDASDVPPYGVDACGNVQHASGEFTFHGLVDAGWLTSAGKPASGYQYRFDTCSQTVRLILSNEIRTYPD